MHHYGTGGNHASFADRNPGGNDSVLPHPRAVFDVYGTSNICSRALSGGTNFMGVGKNGDARPQKNIISQSRMRTHQSFFIDKTIRAHYDLRHNSGTRIAICSGTKNNAIFDELTSFLSIRAFSPHKMQAVFQIFEFLNHENSCE